MTQAHGVRGRSNDGYILVAVLSVMLLLTGFMAAGSMLVRSALDGAKVGDVDVAMSGLAQGGLELTAYQLFVMKLSPRKVDGRRIKFAAGTIAPHVLDESGKVDLNSADPKLLASIFASIGMDSGAASGLVSDIVAMRGADRHPAQAPSSTSPGAMPSDPAAGAGSGAAPSQVAAGTPPAAASVQPPGAPQSAAPKKLRGFQSVDQLGDFPDVTRSDLRELSPMLTVFNPDGKVNILSASREVLMAVPGLTAPKVEEILARRKDAAKDVIGSLSAMLEDAKAYTKTEFGPAFSVRIDATTAKGRKKTINAVVAASKSPNDPYYVLDWWE